MSRIAFFVLLAIAVYIGWRLFRARQLSRPPSASTPRLPMVSCATCGLHVPRNEALAQDDRFFCCEEHRRSASESRE